MAIEVALAETAWHDLDEIYDWVADRSDRDTAQNYVGRILRLCGSLGEFPNRGTARDDWPREFVRLRSSVGRPSHIKCAGITF